MLPVIICEDNRIQCRKIKEIVENLIIKNEYDFEVKLYAENPRDVKKYIKDNDISRGIYILDVDLRSDINGIELAKLIRERDTLGYIIFLTTHSEMSFLTFKYKVEAVDYIIKDNYNNIKNNLTKTFSYINENYNKTEKEDNILTLEQEDRNINIILDEVMFIETSPVAHKIEIHEKNRIVEIYGTLKELEKELPDNFYRSHRAFIVNKDNIIEIDKRNRILHMKNGEECMASYRYIGGLIK